jgi:hypothetical protein
VEAEGLGAVWARTPVALRADKLAADINIADNLTLWLEEPKSVDFTCSIKAPFSAVFALPRYGFTRASPSQSRNIAGSVFSRHV